MTLVGQGLNAPAVRAVLGVQASTIKMHLSRIFRKTGCANQVELMARMADLSLPIGGGTA
jgi:DNA-binding CsgD family transcriptional regulator